RILRAAAERHRTGLRDLRHRRRGGGSGGRARDHPRVLSQQRDDQHRRNESDALLMKYIWLIPLLSGAGAAINGLLAVPSFSRRTAGLVACATMTIALGVALFAFWQLLGLPAEARAYDVVIGQWIPKIPLATRTGFGAFEVPWGFRLDPLAGMMLLVVTGIG